MKKKRKDVQKKKLVVAPSEINIKTIGKKNIISKCTAFFWLMIT